MSEFQVVEVTPELDELLQDEVPERQDVGVYLVETAGVHQLPNTRVRIDSLDGVGTSLWVKALDTSRKRQNARLVALDGEIRVRVSSSGTGMRWPQNVPLPITHMQEVWVLASTTTTDVSVTEEFWAD